MPYFIGYFFSLLNLKNMYHLVFKKTGEILQSCATLDEIQDLLIDYEHNDYNTNNYFVEQYEIISLPNNYEDLFTF